MSPVNRSPATNQKTTTALVTQNFIQIQNFLSRTIGICLRLTTDLFYVGLQVVYLNLKECKRSNLSSTGVHPLPLSVTSILLYTYIIAQKSKSFPHFADLFVY